MLAEWMKELRVAEGTTHGSRMDEGTADAYQMDGGGLRC